jgi:hypothetical protein
MPDEKPEGGCGTGSSVTEAGAASAPPGGVYLCQVGDQVSCGACCGLYNTADASRGRLQALLSERTERFKGVPRDEDAMDAFRLEYERREPQARRPFHDFYHCPFLGFAGADGPRVGCLLHPRAPGNGGIDYRGLSFYGGMACRDYFCPSHRSLPAVYKEIVRAVCRDWYVYGLMVTEERMLDGFFREIERRLGRRLQLGDITAHPLPRAAVTRFLGLKLEWPFRSPGGPGPGNYFFSDGLHVPPQIDYGRIGAAASAHDAIFREMNSAFGSAAELEAAEAIIEDLIAPILANK